MERQETIFFCENSDFDRGTASSGASLRHGGVIIVPAASR